MANNVAGTVACDRIEIITGTGRRKAGTAEEKLRLVAEASAGRGSVAEVSRRYGVCRSLLFRWRRQVAADELGGPAGFVPVVVAGGSADAVPVPAPAPAACRLGMVEIVLGNGRLVRVAEDIAPARLAGLVRALDR
ncbi:MAG: transposase [Rhodospirillales bacterium]|nr:transposase [Rhodospirillales bacterium]